MNWYLFFIKFKFYFFVIFLVIFEGELNAKLCFFRTSIKNLFESREIKRKLSSV